jgi:hypothetical protein
LEHRGVVTDSRHLKGRYVEVGARKRERFLERSVKLDGWSTEAVSEIEPNSVLCFNFLCPSIDCDL